MDGLGLLVKPDNSNASAVGLSLFFVVGSLIQIVGIIFSKPLADRFGKKAVFMAASPSRQPPRWRSSWSGPTSIGLLFWLGVLWAIGWGPTVPLLWVMIADAADYSEWKTHRRATGFVFAGILFALKAGLSLGGALSAWIIDAYGYVPNVVQTERALFGIRLGASVYPAIALVLVFVCLAIYPIGKALGLRIQGELAERRKRYQPDGGMTMSARQSCCRIKDRTRSADERTADLLARMTLEEKVAQMMCVWQQKAEMLVDDAGALRSGEGRGGTSATGTASARSAGRATPAAA